MTPKEIVDALAVLRPGAQYVFSDTDLSTLVFSDKTICPTDKEILDQIAVAQQTVDMTASAKWLALKSSPTTTASDKLEFLAKQLNLE